MYRLDQKFFQQPTLKVAKKLLGKKLIFNNLCGIINETEAYIGEDDPACHAAKGKTKRTAVMYGMAGYSYVYMIYGMYYCLNIVTENEGFPAAVLIRGLTLPADKIIKLNSNKDLILNGPGKLCSYLEINTSHNNINLNTSKFFYIQDHNINKQIDYIATPRIGIKVGLDKLWRFKIIN